jgi:hypothetical protein
MSPDLLSPWKEFLLELDALVIEPVELHCIGGFAIVAAYGLKRGTNDLDYFTVVPYKRIPDLEKLGGEGSRLANKYKVHVHHAGVAALPEGYRDRMKELFPGRFKNIRLYVLDPYDLVLSKLSRNVERDREDVAFLAKAHNLQAATLRTLYEKELRVNLIGSPERHDATLEFWLEAYFSHA